MTRHGKHTCGVRALRKSLSSALVLGSLLAVGALATPALATDTPSTPLVMTTEGPVQGFVQQGVHIFLGIPYAAPVLLKNAAVNIRLTHVPLQKTRHFP